MGDDGPAFVAETITAWECGGAPLFEKPNLKQLGRLLKRPPFKFLADVTLQTIDSTNSFKSLYTQEERQSARSKDKEVRYLVPRLIFS